MQKKLATDQNLRPCGNHENMEKQAAGVGFPGLSTSQHVPNRGGVPLASARESSVAADIEAL